MEPRKTPHYFPVLTGLSSAVSETSHVSYCDSHLFSYSLGYLTPVPAEIPGFGGVPYGVDPIRSGVEYTYGTPMSVLPSFAERKRVWVFRRCTLS